MKNKEKSFGKRLMPLGIATAVLVAGTGALKYSSTPREFESRIRTPDGIVWNAQSRRTWNRPALDFLIIERVKPQNSTEAIDKVNFYIDPETGEFEGAGVGSSKFGRNITKGSEFTKYKRLFEETVNTGHSQPYGTRIGHDLAKLTNRKFGDQIRNYKRNVTNVSVAPTHRLVNRK